MASKTAASMTLAEEESIIRSRILTQTSVFRAEAPLKRLAKR